MAPEDGSAPPPRKVRSACRRCRQKRVKCDGGIPACSNCARAKVDCIDVHTGNNELSIPRDFAVRCCARIEWLEQQLGTLCPDFDFSQGPKVNADFMETLNASRDSQSFANLPSLSHGAASETSPDAFIEEAATNKRCHSAMESEADSPLSAKARSVAIDLGMLSLQSDSRQKHYLGSSSGLLFAKLMGLDNELRPEQASQVRRLAPRRVPDEIYRSLYDQLKHDLPPPEVACFLFEVYFQNIHVDQPFLHPASLINAYQALYLCSQAGYNGSVDRNGWIDTVDPFHYNGKMDHVAGRNITPISIATAVFHVFMTISLSATILTRKKNYDYSPTRFQRMAMSAAAETFSSISVPSLQAVLLLAVQSLIEPASVNIWTLSHIAMSHCVDIGLHRESSGSEMPSVARAMLRFIFWTVYSLDRSISTIQGRPLGIRDETFDVQLPDERDIFEMMTLVGNDLVIELPSSHILALSVSRFRLDRHISEIKLLLYHLPTQNKSFVWPTNLPEIQSRLKSDLDKWVLDVQRITPNDTIDDEEKIKFQFEKMRHEQLYHSAISLLFQPSQAFPSPSEEALFLCYQSCSKRLEIYDAVNHQDMLYYNWRNIHGIFSSGATIVYCAWASRDLQRTIPFAKLLRDLRTCSNHLSIGSQWWPSVRNGKESFEMMIDLIIKYFSDIQLRVQGSIPPLGQSWPLRDRTEHPQPSSYHSVTGMDDSMSGVDSTPGSQQRMQLQRLVSNGPNQPFPPVEKGQSSFDNLNLSMPIDPLEDFDPQSIETAMENFMAGFLHEDWGWDPFSSSTGTLDHQGPV